MSSAPTQLNTVEKPPKSETIFKYLMYVCLLVIAISVPGFVSFRQFCNLKGYHSYSFLGLYMVLVGFFAYFVNFISHRLPNTRTTGRWNKKWGDW